MRIAICDDDALCREAVLTLVREYISHRNREISVSVFDRATALMDEVLRTGGYDIYILDIIMPGMNGIHLGKDIRQVDPIGRIVYLTARAEYAIDSFQVKAFDYLLKPATAERLFATLDDAIEASASRKEKSLIVKARENSMKISLDSILYIQLNDRKIRYYLVSGAVIESNSIRTGFAEGIRELLSDSRFALCGAALAVNLHHITMISSDTLSFHNGQTLYVGKRAGREIRSLWADFWRSDK